MGFGSNHANLSNWSSSNGVPKLKVKSTRSENVQLDCTSAPGATVNGHSLRRNSMQVEPPARHAIHTRVNHPNFVKGVSGGDEDTVTGVEIDLSYLFERSCLVNPGLKRLRDSSQISFSETCCTFPIGASTRA